MERARQMAIKKRTSQANKSVITAQVIFFVACGLALMNVAGNVALGMVSWVFIVIAATQLGAAITMLVMGIKVRYNPAKKITIGLLAFCAYFLCEKFGWLLLLDYSNQVNIPFIMWIINFILISIMATAIKKAKYYDYQKPIKQKTSTRNDDLLDIDL